MKWNLKNRITVPTAAIIVAITAAIGSTSFIMSRSALKVTLNAHLKDVCTSNMGRIEAWMEGHRQNLILWSARPETLSALPATGDAEKSRKIVSDELTTVKGLYGCFETVNLADATGMTVAGSNPENVGKVSVGERQYFKDALAGKTVISEVMASRATGNPVVVIATPVKDGQTVRGVLYSVLDLNTFSSKVIAPIRVLKTGYAFLYDETGVVIAHPDKARIFKSKMAENDWGRQIQAMRQGGLDYSLAGLNKCATFTTSETLGWGFVVTVPMAELEAPVMRMAKVNVALGGGALILGVLIMLLTARSITLPIHDAAGHLNQGVNQTAAAANQVSATSQSLAEGTGEQAASIEETSSSLEELSSMTKRNAENAQKANELAKQTRQAADKGADDMQTMGAAMEAIKLSSNDISKIIKTIDEIAFQTNILALNAAVEAARAGEAGMGFAVVADEVRNLAQRSAQAAKETAGKIESAIVRTTQGVEISSKVAQTLNDIVAKVRQVDELVTEVASASREQTQGIAQINTAVSQMDKTTQGNAAIAEETAASAEELNAQAETMRQSVVKLLELVDGVDKTARPPVVASGPSNKLHEPTPTAKHSLPSPGTNGNGHREAAAPKPPVGARDAIPLEDDFKNF